MPVSMIVLLMLLISACGGLIQRVSGFGYSIFVMLFLPYFLPTPVAAATVSVLVSCVASGYNAVRYRRDIRFRTMAPSLCAAAVAIPVSVHFAAAAPVGLMKLLLGAVLILFSLYFLFFSSRIHIRPTVPGGLLAGALGGTLNGLFSTGGPPMVLYLVNATEDNQSYFATIQAYFFLTNCFSGTARALSGLVTREVLLLFAVSAVGCFFGNFLGKKIFHRMNQALLRRVIYIGMMISGALMMF
ncbi:MAG: sulfite exporter TauE/SafE family protein [Oscillospiraceae bacterium]|nr:sulfite exporter TauE/SafE family protein [Oscillospiraceae bacterium]